MYLAAESHLSIIIFVPLMLSHLLVHRAGLSTRLTRLQPRAPTAQGAPERVMGISLAWMHVKSGNPKIDAA